MRKFLFTAAAAPLAVLALLLVGSARADHTTYTSLTPNGGQEVLLSDLVSGQVPGLIVGDKLFDNFNYSATGDMPKSDRVNVLAITDSAGNYGISFHAAFVDLVDVDGPQHLSDAAIRFEVAVHPDSAAQGFRISDAHLFGAGTGNFALAGPGAFIAVDENFVDNNPRISDGMTVFASNSGQGGAQLEDWIFFDDLYERMKVQKDIVALSSEEGALPARMTIIDQTFSQQVIPEPASWALFSMAMLSLVFAARRRELC